LIGRSVAQVALRLDLPEAYVERYLKVIRRCLGQEDQTGQARFLEDWQRYGAERSNPWFAPDANPAKPRIHTHG
jgi:predicted solute-binding protein